MDAEKFVRAALECSIFFDPRDPGLSHAEIVEAGRRAGLGDGDVARGMRGLVSRLGATKYQVEKPAAAEFFNPEPKPDYRNPLAFEFVCVELRKARSAGFARIDRDVLVERGVAQGLKRNDVEVAVTIYVLADYLVEKDGAISFAPGRGDQNLPSEQIASRGGRDFTIGRPELATAYSIVKDIIERRNDARPLEAEPLDAFAAALESLGYGNLRMWWVQTVAELRVLDTAMTPVAVCVLAAALVEGALAFVVKHARSLDPGPFKSTDFDRDPRTWKIDDLVTSAATGKENAILDPSARTRAAELIKTRQRIHAGRMLAEFPSGVPDLRPEEGRDARATAELVTRRILDWLGKHPPPI